MMLIDWCFYFYFFVLLPFCNFQFCFIQYFVIILFFIFRVVQNIIDHKPKTHYFIAVDDSKNTFEDIVKVIITHTIFILCNFCLLNVYGTVFPYTECTTYTQDSFCNEKTLLKIIFKHAAVYFPRPLPLPWGLEKLQTSQRKMPMAKRQLRQAVFAEHAFLPCHNI